MTEQNKLKDCKRCSSKAKMNDIWRVICTNPDCMFSENYQSHQTEAPSGEVGELIERIDKALNNNINTDDMEWQTSGLGRLEARQVLTACKAQLQQAQKMRVALQAIIVAEGEMLLSQPPQYRTTYIAKQALNNKG